MRISTVILLFLYRAMLHAQLDTILIRTFYSNHSLYEEYQISLSDSFRNGYFKRCTSGGKILTTGEYKKGEKAGIWVWYQKTEARVRDTVEIYDYDNKKEIYYKDTADKSPRYPGGFDEFTAYLIQSVRFPTELIKKHDGKLIMARFKLNCNGKITDIDFNIKSEFRDSIIESIIITALTNENSFWMPCKDPFWDNDNTKVYLGMPFKIMVKQ